MRWMENFHTSGKLFHNLKTATHEFIQIQMETYGY